ncbi:NAD(P)/FAD-dependent oxidoreductase [Wolbachia endosymbiont of Atemnus politus]|uniref:NAD(P)/FAD-dependent oxidoreductase n=1 Tax=Wolbachia endosymbiont of Atemnus politus TaxID=2682840 RepID=UPI001573F83A|nr:NAD(P)/FAD-dependent oxidoreductase [Wolbachia endosymbiont of Atemnus politus]NSM56298.1 NAD(P)/FAD-dependent oxidoreductase [Wolbachia endosymbiont of Atemnus politus]NSX82995.1 SidA/IucD/PvdA family monooxygenase [Wolbachia endosymbiont of Atemnus politus]
METDIVIIGAGPVGIFTAFQAGMLDMRCHIIDILDQAGGQCAALYPEKPIYDIPGYPVITAQRLIEQLMEQALPFEPVYHLSQRVEKISNNDNQSFTVITNTGTEVKCKAVIIAAGNGVFEPNRPPLSGILEYENKSIFYSINKISDFQDKTIVIAGGGDSAADWTIELSKVAKKIYVIHRRKEFRCAPEMRNKLESLESNGKIELVVPYQLHELAGNNGQLNAVIVKNIASKEEKEITTDFLLPFFGLSMNLGPINNWDIQLEHSRIVVDQATLRTSRDRIYAIGDIATYLGKLKLILNGFAESAMACYDIYKVIHNSPVNFQYSTSKGIHGKA